MNRKWNSAASDRDPRSKAHSNKMNRWFEARKKYEKTPLGRLESAKNQAVENAQQAWYRAEKAIKEKRISERPASGSSQASRAKSLFKSGKSYAQIAAQLGISESQVARILKR